ncbi:MAG: glycosyltransferase [Bacteroidales bacterium]|nr:glycosyltransferase [Bacteroidales bacterium]
MTYSEDITVKFVDFWPAFDHRNNKFVDALSTRHRVTVLPAESDDTPDILFYSCYNRGRNHLRYDCVKIYFTGENDCPDFNECDYALSFYPLHLGDRHLRYPLYMLYEYDRLGNPPMLTDAEALNRGFCSLVMRNSTNCDPRRIMIADLIGSYRPLSYGGSFRNNTGGCVADKIDFISRYKFNLALENSIVEGYVTEKILEPLVAYTVPIYWGSHAATTDFNPDAFINAADYDTSEGLLEAVKQLDNDPASYLAMLRAPRLRGGISPDFDSQLADFLDTIATTRRRYTTPYGEQRRLLDRSRALRPIVESRHVMRLLKRLTRR